MSCGSLNGTFLARIAATLHHRARSWRTHETRPMGQAHGAPSLILSLNVNHSHLPNLRFSNYQNLIPSKFSSSDNTKFYKINILP